VRIHPTPRGPRGFHPRTCGGRAGLVGPRHAAVLYSAAFLCHSDRLTLLLYCVILSLCQLLKLNDANDDYDNIVYCVTMPMISISKSQLSNLVSYLLDKPFDVFLNIWQLSSLYERRHNSSTCQGTVLDYLGFLACLCCSKRWIYCITRQSHLHLHKHYLLKCTTIYAFNHIRPIPFL